MRRLVLSAICILVATLALATTAQAQSDQPRIISTTLTPAAATVGDRLTLTIVVEHGEDVSWQAPGFAANFGALEIVEIRPERVDERDGQRRTTFEYVLAAFSTGPLEAPALDLRWRGATGEGTLSTQPQPIEIISVLPPGENTLRALKPQLDLGGDGPPLPVPLAFVVAFIALTLLGYLLVAKAIAARPQPAPAPARPPHELARDALDALLAQQLATRDLPQHYARLAEIVRHYISARFYVPAYAMTRREIEPQLARAGIDRFVARVTGNLLEQCTAVEFAGFQPAPERIEADITAAYEIIERTRPVEVAPAATVAPQPT